MRNDNIGRALRRGHLFVREMRVTADAEFNGPIQGEIAAWSRIDDKTAVIMAFNTHGNDSRGAEVTIDANLHPEGSTIRVLYRSDWSPEKLASEDPGETVPVRAP